jgi:hypothetical protein
VTNELRIVPNYLAQIRDLTPVEQQGVNAFLKSANDDSKAKVVEAVKKYRILMSNEYECPPIGVRRYFRMCFEIFIFFRLQQSLGRMAVEQNFIHP